MDNGAGNPPIPWIGKQAQALAESSHPWKLSQDHQAIIGIRYHGTAQDHLRCRFSLLFPHAGFWLTVILSLNILRGAMIGLMLMLPTSSTTALTVALVVGHEVLAGVIFSLIGLVLIHWIIAWVSSRSKVVGEASDVLLTTQGIVSIRNGKNVEIPWRQMRSVNEIVGDLLFVGKNLKQGVYIPRTAFTSKESKKNFHDAAVSLWKTNGDPYTLSPEICKEFSDWVSN